MILSPGGLNDKQTMPGDAQEGDLARANDARAATMSADPTEREARSPVPPDVPLPFARPGRARYSPTELVHSDAMPAEPGAQHEPATEYRAAGKLHGRVAIITGGESELGHAVARLFASEGADVAIAFPPEHGHSAALTASDVQAEGRQCLRLAGDIRDSNFCIEAVDRTVATLGRLDIVVNISEHHHDIALSDVNDELISPVFDSNVFGYFYLARAAVRHLPKGSAIINTGSAATVHAFTRSQATRLFDRGIRVNCIDSGPDDAEGRNVDEIAPAFVFFASTADSRCITGEVLTLVGTAQ